MTPEEAMAYSQGEFRGKVLTSLESIQSELTEHKKDHRHNLLVVAGVFAGLSAALVAAVGFVLRGFDV